MNVSSSRKKGFTFIELAVTVGVFAILSTLAVGNFRNTTKALSLNSLANLIASDIRRAQVKGISNQSYPGTNYIAPAVGISFDKVHNTAYMLFVDNPTDPNVPATANNINDNYSETSCDTTHECRERMVITDGSKITKIQGNRTSNGVLDQNIGSLHITFQRPDPEPTIRGITGADTRDYYYVEIWLTSKDGLITKKIAVWKTGMVAILQ